MRQWIAVIAILILSLSLLTGCKPYGYRVFQEDGQYYLSLNYTVTENDILFMSNIAHYVYFDSLEEMISDTKIGNFTEDEMDIILEFYFPELKCDEPCPLPDLDHLLEPIMPAGYEVDYVSWRRSNYSFRAVNGDSCIFFYLKSESYYNDTVAKLDDRVNDGDPDVWLVPVDDAIYYVRYVSDDTSEKYYVYGISNEQYFQARVFGVESLSDEFVASLGFKPYTATAE